jgi:mannose-6-phosphate isomerase
MESISLLKNTVQDYAWGSYTHIPELFGLGSSAQKPQAELWMGAHPKAPSMVKYLEWWSPLDALIAKYPQKILGKAVAVKFDNRLPYLFKVLAAAKPLSLQAHPSLSQAKAGFSRENDLGISFNAPHRNYKDASHKPECICALTPFWALNGFRKIAEIISLFELIDSTGMQPYLRILKDFPNSQGLKNFFQDLMNLEPEQKKQVTEEAVAEARKRSPENPIFKWMMELSVAYPADIGILSPIYLNLVCLQPGEAMFLPAGELHAYLEGMGIELMANSDNVLRGGLTPKHVDVEELLKVLNFKERNIEVLTPRLSKDGERIYPSAAEEFVLSVITVKKGTTFDSSINRSVELMICTQGEATIADFTKNDAIRLKQGTSVIIPAATARYRIEGEAMLYKAAVPARPPAKPA